MDIKYLFELQIDWVWLTVDLTNHNALFVKNSYRKEGVRVFAKGQSFLW